METAASRSPGFDGLIFDLEVVPAQGAQPARIIKVGALRADTGAVLEMATPSGRALQSALQRLDALAQGASCVVGHNLLAHDLPLLQSAAPSLGLLQLPVIDTLRLSPLAFPQNPYHRLIKDHKLIGASLNSPLADCRATWSLLQDQWQAFSRLHANAPEELACYQALVAAQAGPGLGDWLQGISGQAAPSREQLQALLPALLRESDPVLPRDLKVCRLRLRALLNDDLSHVEQHWPIAYALAWLRVSGGNSVLAPWVRHQFPEVGRLIAQLRDTPCADPACQYCRGTYHAMAMRLTGTSFGRRDQVSEDHLRAVLQQAARLLEGRHAATGAQPDEADEDDLRERLLRGYRYILVDEYQDIDEDQYRLVSALAGRHAGEDGRLCLLAVGDDDQNIYAFRHTSNRYIERFREDYGAQLSYLVENYRSTRHIIHVANHLIAGNTGRLKAGHPIRIDQARDVQPLGGRWKALDPAREGRVLCLSLEAAQRSAANLQAQAVMTELQRLLALEPRVDWNGCAVLARRRRYLDPVLAWCEQRGVAYSLAEHGDAKVPLTRRRGFVRAVEALRGAGVATMMPKEAAQWLLDDAAQTVGTEDEPAFFRGALLQLEAEFGECQLARGTIVDWLYDHARELRQQPRGGLFLGTVHAAKGLEFRHVALLDGGWDRSARDTQDERRLFYVGMTRARETLTLCALGVQHPFHDGLPPAVLFRKFEAAHVAELDQRYQPLGLSDVDLDYAGRQPDHAAIHQSLRDLRPGDLLRLVPDDKGMYLLQDSQGTTVGRTAGRFQLGMAPERVETVAVLVRYADDVADEAFRARLRCDRWEVVLPRLIWL